MADNSPARDSAPARGASEPAAGSDGDAARAHDGEQEHASRPVRAAILELLSNHTAGSDETQDTITDILQRRRDLQQERKRLTRELKNESRKRRRVLNRSARLSNADLVEVLQIRQNRAVAKAKAAAA